jgi:3-oxoacyl-[acyl-carrier-protein] synthase-3
MRESAPPSAAGSQPALGLRAIAYCYEEIVPIDTIPPLAADPALLARFKEAGHACFARSSYPPAVQALVAAIRTLQKAGLTAADIDAVVIGTSELRDWKGYPEDFGAFIVKHLNLTDIPVVGVTLGGCANYGPALRVAHNMIAAEGFRHVLVTETNQVRGDLNRVSAAARSGALGHILADGAVSYIATRGSGEFKVLAMQHIVKPIRDAATHDAYIKNNVAGLRHVVGRALAQAGLTRAQIDKVILFNTSAPLLRGIMNVIDFAADKLVCDNLAKTAHVWGADNLIALHDYCAAANPPAGTRFLLLCQANVTYNAVICEQQ